MNTDALVLNLLVLAVSGATSIVVGLVFKRIGEVGRDVKEIGEKVGKHAEALARGEAQIEALQAKTTQLERDLRELLSDGCARGRDCARRTTEN